MNVFQWQMTQYRNQDIDAPLYYLHIQRHNCQDLSPRFPSVKALYAVDLRKDLHQVQDMVYLQM